MKISQIFLSKTPLSEPCVAFLKKQAQSLNLPLKVHHPGNEQTPLVVITWTGSHPQLPSIVLNSHMDVVPVTADKWTHPPFAAEMDAEGRIYARGAQDMKSVGMQYLAAIRALKLSGLTQLKRTIHVIFSPNEEIYSVNGWKEFVHTEEFKALNVGLVLDEGKPSANDDIYIWYAGRTLFTTVVECTGEPGHGAGLPENTAGEKASYMLNKLTDFRDSQVRRLKLSPNLTLPDVTTINLTMMKGGVQSNVIPDNITMTFDVRVALDVDLVALKKLVSIVDVCFCEFRCKIEK